LNVAEVARNAGMTRRTLDRRFKAATGRSVLEEIHICRVTRAAKLLAETDIPTQHIIHRAGFSSEEQLRLAFQKSFGTSPQAYRKTHGIHRSVKPG
jgi:transcriptional regulator GlxA family with amidase domain